MIDALNGKEELWRAEVHKADALRSATVVKFEDILEWPDVPSRAGTASIMCIVLISEFVEGRTLRNFINEFPDELSIPFITEWLGTMSNLVQCNMSVRGVVHGDLHPGKCL